MGFYYGPSTPPPNGTGGDGKKKGRRNDDEPGGCLEALFLTRAAFGALAAPLLILFGALGGLVLVIYLFAFNVLVGVVALVLLVGGVAAYAQWERNKFPGGPPG